MTARKARKPDSLPRSPNFIQYLERRGISEESADTCGLRSLPPDEHAELMGQPKLDCEGGLFPYYDLNGRDTGHGRTRVAGEFTPPRAKKPAKFLQCVGAPSRLFLPRNIPDPGGWRAVAQDPTHRILLTEGEAKAIKACQEGYTCMAIAGVWNFLRRGEEDEDSVVIDDFDLFVWRGRSVYIVFDSDAATNPNVKRAELRLCRELHTRGAKPYVIRLPHRPGFGKVGLDDFLSGAGRK